MEHRLGIHIGKLPPSIFVNVPIPLEAYCVDDRDSFFRGRRVLKGSQIEMLVNSTCPWCMKTTLPFRMQTLSLYCIDCPSHLDGELPQRERLCFCCSAHLLSPKRALLSAPEPAFCHQDRGCKESCDSLCIFSSPFSVVYDLCCFSM